jgi:integration host factor subunit alpha
MAREGESRTLTKADIVESVFQRVGFSKKESSELVELVFETMKKTLERGEKIKISGFGKFEVRQKKPRRGRNPQTGTEIEISARRVLSFKPSQVLKSALADAPDDEAAPVAAPPAGAPSPAPAPGDGGMGNGSNEGGFS